ncbi:hypothetical protein [Oligosphaera ethanolica]|uniref:Cellulase (Glycosyl hydrolase family 5) n=1 Tax=Oligosphaera ethanolica TaxID=760260 RepID=A0AAE3VIA7_9BACT|nr:hypothetical protein [Oligosphaera ethanolica]MDQ0290781.1 hypothetical protein [Oligosphaera ethanolica]
MRPKLLLAIALAFGAAAAQAKNTVRLDNAGRLFLGDISFGADFWDGKRNFTQGKTKEWQVTNREDDVSGGLWRREGLLILDQDEPAPFASRLKQTAPGVFTYVISVDKTSRGFTFRTSLPGDAFLGRRFRIDDQELALPLEKDQVEIFSSKARKIAIPCGDGMATLECKGDMSVLIHDYRPRPNNFSLLLGMPKASAELSQLSLTVTFQTYQATPLDLRAAANMGFADDTAADGIGGWTDQGPENDLRMIPTGHLRFRGTDFAIIDPQTNDGKSCIALAGAARTYFPTSATAELTDAPRGNWLFLLHATAWGSSSQDLGQVNVTYQDGVRQDVPVRSGTDVGNWWSPSTRTNGEVVWTGENRSSFVGLYRSAYQLENKPIKRIAFTSAVNAVWMIVAASVGEHRPPRDMSAPFYIVANKDWQPIDFAKDIEPGSVMDFSWRLDAPAGKYGPVRIHNGRFVFSERPDQPLRFYGTNICSGGPYTSKEWAERLADRIATYGFNVLRLHHHDGGMTMKDNTTQLNPESMDQLDYLVHCLKQRGIYITTDLYISRRLPKGEIPEYPDVLSDITAYKAMFWLLDSVWRNWRTYCENYLNHVNPYTGLTIKDDPALISVSIINEGNIKSCWAANAFTRQLYEERFNAWLAQNKADDQGVPEQRNQLFERFLTETYEKRFAQMTSFLREQGVRCPLSDQNMGTTLKLSQMRRLYDYTDNHGYSSHPRFAVKSWQLPSLVTQKSAISSPWSLPASRLYGKPFTVTEFDFAKPNRFRAEGPALLGAYGALQDWDMLVQFAYSHGRENYQRDDRANNHFDLSTDPVKSIAHRIGAALFLNGGVKPAPDAFAVLLDEKTAIPFDSNYNSAIARLGLVTRIGTVVMPNTANAPYPEKFTAVLDAGSAFPAAAANTGNTRVFNAAPAYEQLLDDLVTAGMIPKDHYDPAAGFFRSIGGELELNQSKETFQAVTDACEAFVLPAGENARGRFLAAESRLGRAVIAAVSADAQPLRLSKRMLLLHLTDTQATKAKFASPDMEQLDSWGEPPFLAARGEAIITLLATAGRNYQLHAVDTAGKRLAAVPLIPGADGTLSFKAQVFTDAGQVFAYELEVLP